MDMQSPGPGLVANVVNILLPFSQSVIVCVCGTALSPSPLLLGAREDLTSCIFSLWPCVLGRFLPP